jgi:hypothetical protein
MALRQSRYTLLVTAVGPDGKTVTARIPIQIEAQNTPSSGATEQSDSTPLGGSLFGDGDPPAADPATGTPPAAEAAAGDDVQTPLSAFARGASLPASNPEAAQESSAVHTAAPAPTLSVAPAGTGKKTVGTVLLLGMLGLGSAAAGYKARSLLSLLLRGIRAGNALH